MLDKFINGVCLSITAMVAVGYAILVLYGAAFALAIIWTVLQVVLSFFR